MISLKIFLIVIACSISLIGIGAVIKAWNQLTTELTQAIVNPFSGMNITRTFVPMIINGVGNVLLGIAIIIVVVNLK